MDTRSSLGLVQTYRTRWFAAALVLLLGGCKGEQPGSTAVATSEVPTGWTVTIGSSGGFTGSADGYRVDADGQVSTWSRVSAQAEVTSSPLGTASGSSVTALYAAMTSGDLLATRLDDTGNMTIFLEWRQGQDSRRYSWIETSAPPAPVARAYQAALAAVENARTSK